MLGSPGFVGERNQNAALCLAMARPLRVQVPGGTYHVVSRGNARDMHYGVGEVIARASQDVYLFPGDVFGSGTVGSGCLLELGPETHRWLSPGDEVTLAIERLGALTNRIV